jgi:long-chain acyl-CoA synthetase
VLGTHRAYTITGLQLAAWLSPVLERGDKILLPLPLFHVYANVGVQSFAFVTGNPLALVPNPRDLPDLLGTIRHVRPAFFNGVPTLYTALLNHPDVVSGKVDFKTIKCCFSGAAPLLAETKHRFESITSGRIVEGYSLTEAMMALCVNPVSGTNKIGSVGVPLPDVEVRIVDGETGTGTLPAGQTGEICFSALQLMSGFWNRPDETADVLRKGDDGIWLHTGDLGYLDDDGYLFIVDRKKDLIKTSGYQVWPREVEEALAAHPAVADVGVAGVPDAAKGEAVKAWVVLRPNTTASGDELKAFCRDRLAPYKIPGHIEFRTDLPKTMVGKVLRRELRAGG